VPAVARHFLSLLVLSRDRNGTEVGSQWRPHLSSRGVPSQQILEDGRNLFASTALVHSMKLVERHPQAGYADLYREIAPQLWRAIFAYTGGRADVADDAVGEAFVRAIENGERIRSPYPWLYRTAFRIAAAELRRDVRAVPREGAHFDDSATGDLMRAMRRLPPSQRAAVYLHYQADLPVREVARLTGSSVAAVKVQLHRGRRRLREILGSEEVDDG
jgi:RNA polymerase sigma-70 factor (ECF subfamily)